MILSIFTYYKQKPIIYIVCNNNKIPYYVFELQILNSENGLRVSKIKKLFKLNKSILKEEYISFNKFKDYLKKSKKIVIANGNEAKKDKEIIEIFKYFQVKFSYVDICFFCIKNNIFTQLTKNNTIFYDKNKLCIECSKKEIRRIIYNIDKKISEQTCLFFEKILLKTKNLQKSLSLFNVLTLSNDITKYDMISSENDDINENNINYDISTLSINCKFKNILLKKSKKLLPIQALSIK